MRLRSALTLLALLCSCSGGGSAPDMVPQAPPEILPELVEFHCVPSPECPELTVGGDSIATFANGLAPFRGYGDPSLSYDEQSNTLWMSYSWLSTAVEVMGPPPQPDFLVSTRLARSTNSGVSFDFVREINQNTLITHPVTNESGWLTHEVSTVVQNADGGWQVLWLQYFDPVGEPERKDFLLNRSVASSPTGLGDVIEPWIRTAFTSELFGATERLSSIPELDDCAAFTEPALFTEEDTTYLAMNCIVIRGAERQLEEERLFVLRQSGDNYQYVDVLIDNADAASLGGDVLEQADFKRARDGQLLLIATPINHDANPPHQGCVALEVESLVNAAMRRTNSNGLVQRARITADGDALGPGLCTYHAESNTGIIIAIPTVTEDPVEIVFTMYATGVHP